MASISNLEIEARVRSLELQIRTAGAMFALGILAAFLLSWSRTQELSKTGSEGVLRLRGLVIEDEHGCPRVLLGAPVASVPGRKRTDPAFGMVVLNESGADRVQVGNVGNPQVGGVVQPRIAGASGIMICDLEGDERGGYGFLDNGRVVLGMDDPSGEGVMLFIAPDMHCKGMIVNEERRGQIVQRLFLGLGQQGEALLKLQDGKGTERVQMLAGPEDDPKLLVHDEEGQELDDLFER